MPKTHVKWINLIPVPKEKYKLGNHYVYLVYSKFDNLYKIGWSGSLYTRLKKLETERRQIEIATPPYKLVHSIATQSGRYLECQLHLIFAHRHIAREWFRLSRSDKQWIIDLGEELDLGIPTNKDIIPPLAEKFDPWLEVA